VGCRVTGTYISIVNDSEMYTVDYEAAALAVLVQLRARSKAHTCPANVAAGKDDGLN
jgi:hypothetical protein